MSELRKEIDKCVYRMGVASAGKFDRVALEHHKAELTTHLDAVEMLEKERDEARAALEQIEQIIMSHPTWASPVVEIARKVLKTGNET